MESEGNPGWTPLVIVGTGATVVIERALTGMLRHDIQVALEGSDPVVGFLSTLTANGVHDLPRFAYVGREGSAVRILLRGDLVAVLRDSRGRESELTARSVSTWTEVVRTDCVDVALHADGELVTIASYGVPLIDELPAVVGDRDVTAPDEPAPDRSSASQSAAVSVDETIFPGPDVVVEQVAAAAANQPLQPVTPPPAAAPPMSPSSDDEVDLSHLFETRHVGAEAAAIRGDDAALDAPPPAGSPGGSSLADLPPPMGSPVRDLSGPVPPSGPSVAAPVDPAAVGIAPAVLSDLPPPAGAPVSDAPPPAGLIAGVPGAGSRAPALLDADGDHDGLTISPAQLAALRGGGSGRPSVPSGPQLQAVSCPSGHLNPPQADRCRACGAGIVDRSISVVSRPSLGHLSFDGGTVVDIDRPLLIGRKPTAEGLAGGAEVPGLVVLPDPEGSLSRVHAEVRIEGWQVLVVDRNSTNGTVVEIPGQPPVLLRPMEPCLISPGACITFADVATCVFQTGPR